MKSSKLIKGGLAFLAISVVAGCGSDDSGSGMVKPNPSKMDRFKQPASGGTGMAPPGATATGTTTGR